MFISSSFFVVGLRRAEEVKVIIHFKRKQNDNGIKMV